MRRDQQIQVNEMLLEREELFLRIHRAEQAVVQILGGPYPFTTVDLPSNRRVKRKAGPPRATATAESIDSAARPLVALRRLESGESHYRITYRQFSNVVIEEHGSIEAVRTLLACQGSQLEVQKTEVLQADGTLSSQLF